MEKTKSSRNYSIDYFKYFCALLIIVIHEHPFVGISVSFNELFTGTVTRIAVPFFFLVSGYFYSKKLYAGKKPFKPYVLKLWTAYTFWSAVYAVRLIIIESQKGSLDAEFFKGLLLKYLFFGVSEHLWFCIALFISVCIITLLHKIKLSGAIIYISAVIYIIACLGVTYRTSIGVNLPVLGSIFTSKYFFQIIFRLFMFGLCFVFLGDFLAKSEGKFKDNGKINACLIISLILYIAEKTFNIIREDNLLINVTLFPLVMFIFIALLQHPGSGKSPFSKYARNAATFTYYFHSMLIMLFANVIPSPIIKYFAVAGITLALSIILTKINNKKLNYLMM